jgi:hypothetical protein
MTELEIRARIDDCLRSYCRGIDRLHGPSVEAAFHPGAALEGYGSAEALTIDAFVPYAMAALGKRFVSTQHRISNTSYAVAADHAMVETYVLAYHVEQTDEGRRLLTFAGRYIDRFEPRDGDWRIVRRTLRNDFSMVEPMGEPMGGAYVPSGRGGTPDPIFP